MLAGDTEPTAGQVQNRSVVLKKDHMHFTLTRIKPSYMVHFDQATPPFPFHEP